VETCEQDASGSREESMAGSCEHDNGPSGCITTGGISGHLSDSWPL
jgi:hypothetical protein